MGVEETQVSTAAISSGTRMFAKFLLHDNSSELHQVLQAGTQNGSLCTSRFIHLVESIQTAKLQVTSRRRVRLV